MRPKVKLRELSAEENTEVRNLANSQNAAAKLVKRANIIVGMLNDAQLTATDAGVRAGYSTGIGATWVRRFNEKGVDGLNDKPRSGRNRLHSEKIRSELINLALQKPRTLAYPFEMWTLERLKVSFKERQGVELARSTIFNWMAEEGFEWKRQQSWFHDADKHDPQFVEKRGPSSAVISSPHQTPA